MNKPTEKQIEAAMELSTGFGLFRQCGNMKVATGLSNDELRALTAALAVEAGTGLSVDALAQEIRRVDGNHYLGAGALAEALMPFLAALTPASSAVEGEAVAEYRIVFDGFPSPEGPRFIEVEDEAGKSIKAGEWRKRADGLCELVIRPAPTPAGDAMLRLAVAAVLEADKEFRSNMGPSWEGDPLSDEIDGLRRIFEALPASPAPHQEGRADG